MSAHMGERLSKEQLVRLVERISRAEGTEEEIEAWIALLEHNVPDPEVADLIFWPPEGKELSAAEVVECARLQADHNQTPIRQHHLNRA